MRALQRLPEPDTLLDRKKQWLDSFLASGKSRPDSNKYAHKEIRQNLISMSHCKCFYCETQLKDAPKEVDHHIEVSVDKTLAFEWTNLHLCCDNCNNKIPHNVIAIHDALNPCVDTDAIIQAHLTFEKELIKPNHNSKLGMKTIQKYRLDSELLDNKRRKKITEFYEFFITIQQWLILEQRNELTQAEKEVVEAFKRDDNPYSLMFKVLLEKYGF